MLDDDFAGLKKDFQRDFSVIMPVFWHPPLHSIRLHPRHFMELFDSISKYHNFIPSRPPLTHQDSLLYVFIMVASALSTKKAVALFHALSDETRLALLDRLRNGEQCVCELTDAMNAAQSRLSFHLKVLKDAGLVEDRREGRWMYYSLSASAIEELEDLVDSLKKAAKSAHSSGRCC